MPISNKIEDLFNVKGLVAVTTGGGSGLGLYAARALDANGAKAVYIVGRRASVWRGPGYQKGRGWANRGHIKWAVQHIMLT